MLQTVFPDDVVFFVSILTVLCPSTLQSEWREEVKKHFEKIKSEGTCIHRLDEELIRRRRDELRCVRMESQRETRPHQVKMLPVDHMESFCLYVYTSCTDVLFP